MVILTFNYNSNLSYKAYKRIKYKMKQTKTRITSQDFAFSSSGKIPFFFVKNLPMLTINFL